MKINIYFWRALISGAFLLTALALVCYYLFVINDSRDYYKKHWEGKLLRLAKFSVEDTLDRSYEEKFYFYVVADSLPEFEANKIGIQKLIESFSEGASVDTLGKSGSAYLSDSKSDHGISLIEFEESLGSRTIIFVIILLLTSIVFFPRQELNSNNSFNSKDKEV